MKSSIVKTIDKAEQSKIKLDKDFQLPELKFPKTYTGKTQAPNVGVTQIPGIRYSQPTESSQCVSSHHTVVVVKGEKENNSPKAELRK